jgi:TPR repeat protein
MRVTQRLFAKSEPRAHTGFSMDKPEWTAMRILILALVALAWTSGNTLAASRVALVIGNSAYAHVPTLKNPENDAKAIGEALSQLGFEVTDKTDLDLPAMNQALRDFSKLTRDAEMAVIYYAGHGIEVDKQNFLIPTDAKLASDADVEFETVPLDQMDRAVSGASLLSLVMIDACRDNPFANQMTRKKATRSIGRGLARVDAPEGTLIAFAAQEGTTAEDGDGKHSPFASALLETLEEPGLDIRILFGKVRDTVMAATDNRQRPFTYGSLPGRSIFLVNPSITIVIPPDGSAQPGSTDIEMALWDTVKDSDNPALLRSYLDKYSDGAFAEVARVKIDDLMAGYREQITQCNALAEDPDQRDKTTAGVDFESLRAQAGEAGMACAGAILAEPDNPKLLYQAARARHAEGRHDLSLPLFTRSADAGYPLAISSLGWMYFNGEGVAQDKQKGIAYDLKAADAGDADAQYTLGVIYETGDGVAADASEAARFYRMAADQGYTDAQYDLGRIYSGGAGLPADKEKAAHWFRKAADQDDARAAEALKELCSAKRYPDCP